METLVTIYLIGMLVPAFVVLYAALVLHEPAEDLKRLRSEGDFLYGLFLTKCVLERALIWPLIALIWIVRTVRTFNLMEKK